MSTPRYWWYGSVLRACKKYPAIKNENSFQSDLFTRAIEDALDSIAKGENGEAKVEAMRKLYFSKTHTIDGVALSEHYSRRTVQRWASDFVNLVGENAGFKGDVGAKKPRS